MMEISPGSFICAFILFFLKLIPNICLAENGSETQLLANYTLKDLPKISVDVFKDLKTREPLAIKGLTPESICTLPSELAFQTFYQASDKGLGFSAMELLSDERYQIKGQAMYFSRELLLEIENHFELHFLYVLKGTLSKSVKDKKILIPKNTYFKINSFLIGNGGQFWAFYDHPITYKSKSYDFFTGKYSLYKNNLVTIGRDSEDRVEYTSLVGRNNLKDSLQPLKGPFNISIKKLLLDDKNDRIISYVEPFGKLTVPNYKIQFKP